MKKQFKASVYNLAIRITKWNHAAIHCPSYELGDMLKEEAARNGFTVTVNEYEGIIHATPKYGESLELMLTLDAVSASKKAHPLPLCKRYERKDEEEDARWYNAKRYGFQGRCITSYGRPMTCAKEAARNLRHMKVACKYQKADDIAYWAQVLTDSMNSMRKETAARMNYPKQVEIDLNGNEYNDLPF